MRLVFNNMQDYVDNMINGAIYKIEYIDEISNEELLEEFECISKNSTSVTVKNQNGIKTIDTLWVSNIACLSKLKLVLDMED